jgi:hypothetical protein
MKPWSEGSANKGVGNSTTLGRCRDEFILRAPPLAARVADGQGPASIPTRKD